MEQQIQFAFNVGRIMYRDVYRTSGSRYDIFCHIAPALMSVSKTRCGILTFVLSCKLLLFSCFIQSRYLR